MTACKGPLTCIPQNIGCIEDLISKNISSKHIEICKVDRVCHSFHPCTKLEKRWPLLRVKGLIPVLTLSLSR